ncbi:MAG: helix-turn-helix transcriptional regulator [Bdellovibrionota bacterium]|nr:helix-turn-helix transcriptional regulator [Bdellovibrionota bacterium]
MKLALSSILGDLIQENRVHLNEVSKNTGIPKSTLFGWRYGAKPQNFEQLKRLAEYFNVEVHFLLYGANEKRGER